VNPPKRGKAPSRRGSDVPRKTGRHPRASQVVVRLTEPAWDDVQALVKLDPQVARRALKKMIHLERDPEAGEPLRGALIGWRKISVGDRDWRIVWRVTHDEVLGVIVDVAEVWAAGARNDSAVYTEMIERVATLPDSPQTRALAEVIARLTQISQGLSPTAEPQPREVPSWLEQRLTEQAGLDRHAFQHLTLTEAVDAWTAWSSRPRPPR
jgi:mRNA interferase RelE/StbE